MCDKMATGRVCERVCATDTSPCSACRPLREPRPPGRQSAADASFRSVASVQAASFTSVELPASEEDEQCSGLTCHQVQLSTTCVRLTTCTQVDALLRWGDDLLMTITLRCQQNLFWCMRLLGDSPGTHQSSRKLAARGGSTTGNSKFQG